MKEASQRQGFKGRDDWRAWLAENHATAQERWLPDRFPHPYTKSDAQAFLAAVAALSLRTTFAIATDGIIRSEHAGNGL